MPLLSCTKLYHSFTIGNHYHIPKAKKEAMVTILLRTDPKAIGAVSLLLCKADGIANRSYLISRC